MPILTAEDLKKSFINPYGNLSDPNLVQTSSSQYDEGFVLPDQNALDALNNLRANRQGHWDSFANMLVRGAGKALLTVPESAGYLLDLPEVIGAQREFDNVLSNWARSKKEELDEALPEYSRFTEEGGEFNPLDREFYWRGGDSVIESMGYLVPGFGIGTGVARGLSLIGKLSGNVIKGASALSAAVGTNYIESMQVAGETYRGLIEQGVDPEIAAKEAKEIIWQGKSMIALELPQYLTLFRGFGTTRAMKGAGDSFVKFKAKDYGMQMGSEAIEEVGLDFISKDNERDALLTQGLIQDDGSTFSKRFIDYATSDEGLTAGFLGALGGVAFQGGGDIINYASDVIKKEKTESQRYSEALGQLTQNNEITKEILKTNTDIFKAQQDALRNNDPVAYKSLQREALKNLAFANAEKGTYSQFLDTLDTLSSMKEDEAAKIGLNTQEINELSQIFKKDAKVYENLYSQATQLSTDKTIQQKGFNVLSNKYLSDNTISAAQQAITKTYSENTSPTFGPTKQRVNKLVNQQTVFNNFVNSIKDTEGPKAEFKQLIQKKLSNVNQQLQQEIENLNNYVDSEFTSDEYAKIRGKKLNESDFKNSLVDNQIQQQEKNLVVAQFESLKAEEEFNNLSNPKVQEQIIQAQQEEIVAQQKQAEKAATKALTDEFNSILNSTNPDVKRLEEINTELKGTSISKDLNNKLAKLKDKLKKAEVKPEVTTTVTNETVVPEALVTQSVEDVFGFNVEYVDNTITATTDSSEVEKVSKEFEGKERAKKQSLTGGYLDVEYVESTDGTLIASLKDEDGNVINVERELDDFIDYNKYPPGTEVTFVIDRKWQQQNNIPDSNWWELPIAAQINGKTVFYINKFNAEPTDGIDSNIEKKIATEFQEQVQRELIAQRKDVTTRLLNGETVIGQITNYGTGTIDGYTKDKGKVIDRLGNGTELFKDVAFAVVDKKASKLQALTDTGDNIVNNSIVTSEAFQSVPNGSVVVLLPSYSRIDGKTELVARPVDRNNLSDTDINIVKHLINTYGKYSREKLNELGLTIPEDVKNVTEYLINNFVYNGRKSGSFFVERVGNERFIKELDPTVLDSQGLPAVKEVINVTQKDDVEKFLRKRKYNIHSKPYFNVEFTNEITKITPADSKTTIAERTSTFINNKNFQVINLAENKMQILRQPSISYNVNKPIKSVKIAAKPVKKETSTQVPVLEVIMNEINKANDKTIASVLKNNITDLETFKAFNEAFKATEGISKLEFAKQYFTTETKETKSNNNPKQISIEEELEINKWLEEESTKQMYKQDQYEQERLKDTFNDTEAELTLSIEDIINEELKNLKSKKFKPVGDFSKTYDVSQIKKGDYITTELKYQYLSNTIITDFSYITFGGRKGDIGTIKLGNKWFAAHNIGGNWYDGNEVQKIINKYKKEDKLIANLSSLDNTKLQQLNEIEKSANPYNALMELIINSKDSDLKSVIFKLKDLNPKIEFTSEISNELAKVVYSDNKIIINKYAVARNPRALEYVVAHEILHLGTLNGLTKNTEFNKKVTELFNFAKSKLGNSYALTNAREFVSEAFTNQEFKEQLKGLEYKGSNVFEKFWSFIKSLFGFNDNVFTLLDKYTNQYLMDFVVDLNGNVVKDNLISDYQIEGLSLQEGYTLVNSMTGLAQDIFRETDINITFAQLKEEIKNRLQAIYDNAVETGELDDDVMLQYEALLANDGDNETFNKLFIRVKANVAYLSDILTKEFDEDINLEDESATIGSESYGREAFQDNPKDKVSLRMKMCKKS
jgi:hypothetical protein